MRRTVLLALPLASALTLSADAFGTSSLTFATAKKTTATTASVKTSTRLFAETEETPAAKDDKSGDAAAATNDILNSPEFLKRKLEVLKSDMVKVGESIETAEKALEEGKVEWGDKFADLGRERKNLQDRMARLSGDAYGAATVEVTNKLLNVLDNFDRAFAVVEPETDEDREVEQKYKDAHATVLETLGSLGVREVECVGKEFDFEQHTAVMTRPSDEYEEGIVMEELQKGFILAEKKEDDADDDEEESFKLIRAAMVVVAA